MRSRIAPTLARASMAAAAVAVGACLPSPVSWSPDSARVAFVDPTGEDEWTLWVADVATGACTPLHVSHSGPSAPAWAPKGDRVACLEAPKEKKGRPTLLLLPLEGPPTRHLLAPLWEFGDTEATERMLLPAGAPSWRPDGTAVALQFPAGTEVKTVVVDPASGQTLREIQEADLGPAVWAPDGRCLAAIKTGKDSPDAVVLISPPEWATRTLWRAPPGEGEPRGLPAWSPDGKRLCLVTDPREDDSSQVWVIDVETGKGERIRGDGVDGTPAWSPTGDRLACIAGMGLAYSQYRDDTEKKAVGRSCLVVIDLNRRRRRPTTLAKDSTGVWDFGAPAWSPDGRWIAYRAFVGDTGVVRFVRPDGRDPRDIYTGGRHMLRLARQLLDTAHNVKLEWKERVAASNEGERLLRELPKRFPKANLDAEIAKLDEEAAWFHK